MTSATVVEANGHLHLIVNRRVVETCHLFEATPMPQPSPWVTIPWYDHPCDLCGERLQTSVDIGEMYGSPKPKYGVLDVGITHGLVHAQCGLDAGWEIA